MLKRYIPFLLLMVVVFSCNKDKLQTKPSIRLKSVEPREVHPGQNLLITLEYTDKEGDLGNGSLTYIRDRVNIRPISDPGSNDKIDTVEYTLPEFPNTAKGDIEVKIKQDFLKEDPTENDSILIKIFVKDLAGNVSDTLRTDTIVAVK